MRSASDQMTPDLQTQERELEAVREKVRTFQVRQMRPGQSAEVLDLLKDMEVLARAEVKLRLKAIDYSKSKTQRPKARLKIWPSLFLPW
jgi:hypothetical protein